MRTASSCLLPFLAGAQANLQVTASAAGLLNAWVDFDRDGRFEPSEQVFSDEALAGGANALQFATPGAG